MQAQSVYGTARAFAHEGHVSLGRNLYPSVPEDKYDRGPQRAGPLTLVADVRLDNREELASALGLAAHEVAIQCDSALVLQAFVRWGEEALDRLVGEFSIALWNSAEQRLLLARDFLGSRPLCYHRSTEFFAFASMPSGLHALAEIPKAVDYDFMAEQLALLPHGGSRTFHRDVCRVEPGHVLTVERSRIQSRRFWTPARPSGPALSPAEYEEGLREVLDIAVRAQLRTTGDEVATHLSGGFDSSAVTVTAARLRAPRPIVAFTAAPRAGFQGPVPRRTRADESELARLAVCGLPNVEHLVIKGGGSPLADLARECGFTQEPPENLSNLVWINRIFDAAQKRGIKTLLTGAGGNVSISYAGTELLPHMLARGRLGRLLRISRQLARNGSSIKALLGQTFGAFAPDWLWSAALKWHGWATDLSTYSAVRPELLGQLRSRARELDHDFIYRPRRDPFETRMWIYQRSDGANSIKATLARYGISVRDPTADQRVVEYCLSVPFEEFVRGGRFRSLARRALADRLPPAIINDATSGHQAADWHEGLRGDLGEIAELIEACERTGASAVLDMDWMRETVRTWPDAGWDRIDVLMRYRAGLLRAASAAHFIRTTEGAN